MAAADIQLLVNTVFYIAIFVSGFVISIPVGVVNVRCSNELFKNNLVEDLFLYSVNKL